VTVSLLRRAVLRGVRHGRSDACFLPCSRTCKCVNTASCLSRGTAHLDPAVCFGLVTCLSSWDENQGSEIDHVPSVNSCSQFLNTSECNINFTHLGKYVKFPRLSSWSTVLEKLIVTQLVKKFLAFTNCKIHYHVHKSSLLAPVLSHINPIKFP